MGALFPFRGNSQMIDILVTIQKAHVEAANRAHSLVLELGTAANAVAIA